MPPVSAPRNLGVSDVRRANLEEMLSKRGMIDMAILSAQLVHAIEVANRYEQEVLDPKGGPFDFLVIIECAHSMEEGTRLQFDAAFVMVFGKFWLVFPEHLPPQVFPQEDYNCRVYQRMGWGKEFGRLLEKDGKIRASKMPKRFKP